MIDVHSLTKRYGSTTVVDDLTFTVAPGVVTGFLGPNGAGKSTTMRMLIGLERPDGGHCTVNGRAYQDLAAPAQEIGALLDASARHPGRSARDHLLAMAATHHIPTRRVDEVLELVGLGGVAHRRTGALSLGMGQRLGIAGALLGDPATIMLDEPVNGLDPDGIRWIRDLLKSLAAEGRTVFVSSHLMSEMALTAEQLVIVGRGQLIADTSVADLLARTATTVRVSGPHPEALHATLTGEHVTVTTAHDGALLVTGLSAAQIGDRAAAHQLTVHELSTQQPSLEEAYMDLTADTVDYHGALTTTTTTTTERTAA